MGKPVANQGATSENKAHAEKRGAQGNQNACNQRIAHKVILKI